jgi:hypothetical protein
MHWKENNKKLHRNLYVEDEGVADVQGGPDVEDNNVYTLAELKTDMCWVKKTLSNHLAHHSKWMFLLVAAVISLASALLVAMVKM